MSTKIRYFSKGNETDGASYCSGVETLVENLIEDNEDDATIVFPFKNGWASVRSTEYRITDQCAQIVLPLPIYKIKKVLIKLDSGTMLKIYQQKEAAPIPVSYFLSDGEEFIFDATDYILSDKEWNALRVAEDENNAYGAPVYVEGIYKDNTFYWKENTNEIPLLADSHGKGWWIFKDETPVYERFLRTLIYKYGDNYTNDSTGFSSKMASKKSNSVTTDVRDWQFRIEYIPVSSKMKIRARKAAGTTVDYIQPFNQRAEVNAASAFGKNMYLTAQKTGVREIKLVKDYTLLSEIPPIGARIRHDGKVYRLVANHYSLTNTVFLRVTHTLSENWSAKSKHVSVDQKYRNWKIPQDILWRNLYWENYLHISFLPPSRFRVAGDITTEEFMRVFSNDTANDKLVSMFCWFYGESKGVTLPCFSYGIGNSLIFSATFRDNLSAGLCRVEDDLCEEALYCNEDGTLDTATVVLTSGIGNGTYSETHIIEKLDETGEKAEYARKIYPTVSMYDGVGYNAPLDNIFKKEFWIDKDAGEALKFVYQVHFTPESSDIVIGQTFAEGNTLVKHYEKREIFVVLSKFSFREGEKNVYYRTDDSFYVASKALAFTTVKTEIDEQICESIRCALKGTALSRFQGGAFASWGIVEMVNPNVYVLLVGCNCKEKTALYFSCSKEK